MDIALSTSVSIHTGSDRDTARVTKKYWRGFRKRHPFAVIGRVQASNKARAAVTREQLNTFYDQLQSVYATIETKQGHPIQPQAHIHYIYTRIC